MLRIILKECHNNKTNSFLFFVDITKSFGVIPITYIWSRIEELEIPFKLRVVMIGCMMMLFPCLGTLRVGLKKLIVI